MLISHIAQKMIRESHGNLHDINHFLKVYAYARTIGVSEGLDPAAQTVLEAAALLHDIACPLCREKYGNTDGAYQEKEGAPLAAAFLQDSGLAPEAIDRVVWLGRPPPQPFSQGGTDFRTPRWTPTTSSPRTRATTPRRPESSREHLFRTASGRALLDAIYLQP